MSVIDTSVVIHLCVALGDRFCDFAGLLGGLIVPQEVMSELQAGRERDDAAARLLDCDSIRCLDSPAPLIPTLPIALGPGESSVIRTALAFGHSMVLIDERKARQVAASFQLATAGTLGLLIFAKQLELITSVTTPIEQLRQRGFRISESLMTAVLLKAGE